MCFDILFCIYYEVPSPGSGYLLRHADAYQGVQRDRRKEGAP